MRTCLYLVSYLQFRHWYSFSTANTYCCGRREAAPGTTLEFEGMVLLTYPMLAPTWLAILDLGVHAIEVVMPLCATLALVTADLPGAVSLTALSTRAADAFLLDCIQTQTMFTGAWGAHPRSTDLRQTRRATRTINAINQGAAPVRVLPALGSDHEMILSRVTSQIPTPGSRQAPTTLVLLPSPAGVEWVFAVFAFGIARVTSLIKKNTTVAKHEELQSEK